jgi:hypothetical protein
MGRNIGAGIAGVIVAIALVWVVEFVGHSIYPTPADLDYVTRFIRRQPISTTATPM